MSNFIYLAILSTSTCHPDQVSFVQTRLKTPDGTAGNAEVNATRHRHHPHRQLDDQPNEHLHHDHYSDKRAAPRLHHHQADRNVSNVSHLGRKGNRMRLPEHTVRGQCKSRCADIARAYPTYCKKFLGGDECENIVAYHGSRDMVELLKTHFQWDIEADQADLIPADHATQVAAQVADMSNSLCPRGACSIDNAVSFLKGKVKLLAIDDAKTNGFLEIERQLEHGKQLATARRDAMKLVFSYAGLRFRSFAEPWQPQSG